MKKAIQFSLVTLGVLVFFSWAIRHDTPGHISKDSKTSRDQGAVPVNTETKVADSIVLRPQGLSTKASSPNLDDAMRNVEAREIANLKQAVHQLMDLGPGIETFQNEIIQRLAQDPSALRLFSESMRDYPTGYKTFGEDLPIVRAQGARVLEAAAKNGNLHPLEAAIRGTVRELNQGPPIKARDADLTDLLSSWIQAKGPTVVEADPSILFRSFNYSSNLRGPVATAIRYVYPDKIGDPQFLNRFMPFLKGEVL